MTTILIRMGGEACRETVGPPPPLKVWLCQWVCQWQQSSRGLADWDVWLRSSMLSLKMGLSNTNASQSSLGIL